MQQLDAAQIVAEAEAATGMTDPEPKVRANLERLVTALNGEAGLSPAGVEMTHRYLVTRGTQRLDGLKWLRDHPEIADEPIDAPVFLTGLPRSGTTYFQYLFDRDPRFRLIRTWESLMPSPPPGADPASVASRRAQWAEIRKRTQGGSDNFDALHLIDEDGSDECHAFMEQSYGAAGFFNLYRVPGYVDYLFDELDFEQTYRVHKRQLQLLQWRGEPPRPWALKYPNHVLAMPAILQVYPDARFVMTHRDPAQIIASSAKLTSTLRARNATSVDRVQVGQEMLEFIARHIDRIMAFDASAQGDRVIHVDYYALVADPVAEMRRIHAGLGIDTPATVADAVTAWRRDNPPAARGKNEYGFAEFGLDADAIRERFAAYIERFRTPTERDGLARQQGAVQ